MADAVDLRGRSCRRPTRILYGSISTRGAANYDAGHRLLDRLDVALRQPDRLLADLLQLFGLERLRADHDVARAELVDQRERLLLGAGADRQHRDHRADAEHHAEHRQRRAQLVLAEAAERGRERVEEPPHGLTSCRRRAARCRAASSVARRIAQRDLVARRARPVLITTRPGGRGAELDRDGLEAGRGLAIDDRLAVLVEHRLARHDERVLLIEHERRGHALPRLHDVAIGLVERDGDREVLHRRAVLARLRELVDELDLARGTSARGAPRRRRRRAASRSSRCRRPRARRRSPPSSSSSGISATLCPGHICSPTLRRWPCQSRSITKMPSCGAVTCMLASAFVA